MKCRLVGIRKVDYVSAKTQQPVRGAELHLMALSDENNSEMKGKRVSTEFVKGLKMDELPVSCTVELVYERVLGQRYDSLVDIKVLGEPIPEPAMAAAKK